MALELVKNLLGIECGSLVGFQLNSNSELDSLYFQSNIMKNTFSKFPSVLLLCRTCNLKGKALYTYFVDSSDVQVDAYIMRMVHFAVPKNESADGVSHMYMTFKEFNPNWPKIKTILVDPLFEGTKFLAEAFPLAEIVLSVFHICKFMQQKIYQMCLDANVERSLLALLKDTMSSPTKSNRENLCATLQRFVSSKQLLQLDLQWLLAAKIWRMHSWRTVPESAEYFQCMEILNSSFRKIFNNGITLESSITSLAKYIRDCKLNVTSFEPGTSFSVHSFQSNIAVCSRGEEPSEKESNITSDTSPPSNIGIWYKKRNATNLDDRLLRTVGRWTDDHIKLSLQRLCTVPAAKLCLKELAVAQESVQIVDTGEDKISVHIQEDDKVVSKVGGLLCTCHFSRTLQLPCRHVLAALNQDQKVLQPEMIYEKWRKKDVKPCENMVEGDLLELLQSSWTESAEKYFTVKYLTDEIMRVLAECTNEEFQSRYNTLRELADYWIGPYEQVKL
ncbi:zinc finger SWIM domain-containing protein 1 [Ambystoma mexicanum]|uniref:zinc finger SWIM domain-containing protein 1 n=1 Tax=Ambystoma mexicanum TaxID=8296 RepID=UPI0037E7B49A